MSKKNGLRERFLAAVNDEAMVSTELGDVLVVGLTTKAKDRMQQAALAGGAWRVPLLLDCCLDPATRAPLFTESDDIGAIPAKYTEPLIDKALELAAVRAEEVEELEGN